MGCQPTKCPQCGASTANCQLVTAKDGKRVHKDCKEEYEKKLK